MVTINQALAKVKADLARLLDDDAIFTVCREQGHCWRDTLLNPAVTLHLFVLQILACNTACWALRLLSGLRPGAVVVGDRAFASYAHLCLLQERDFHGIFRMHQKTIVSFRYRRRHAGEFPKGQGKGKPTSQWIKRLGPNDQVVRSFK